MPKRLGSHSWHWLRWLGLVWVFGAACATMAQADPVVTLRAKYASLDEQLRQNQFSRPLVLDSSETPNTLKGDIYAIVDHPFNTVNAGLNNPDHWCDVMLLHINTKYCRAVTGAPGTMLMVNIGKKTPEELSHSSRVEFNYRVVVTTPDYVEIMLNAKDGPMGTSDFRILLEAVALPNAKTFLHLTYSYAMNFAGRLAMQTYLGTVGNGKVGFTEIGKRADGEPDYIGGMRGVVERNTMRYYLAIDSFLGAVRTAPAAQLEKRLQSWFTAVERYPRQLHEMDRNAYLEMKRAEHLRQQTAR
jgi:hypothetical protein